MQERKPLSQALFWLITAGIAAAVAASMLFSKGGASVSGLAPVVKVTSAPRNAQPVGPYTRFFEKRSAFVRSGAAELDMTYYWYAPQKPWPDGVRFPLVIVLHGKPGNAYAAQYLLQRHMLINYPAFIFFPVLPPEMTWYGPASTPEGSTADRAWPKGLPGAMTIVQSLIRDYPVDVSRIYVLGCSEGGIGAFGAVKAYSSMLAGAISISGGWVEVDASRLLDVPMLVMHGANDSVIPAKQSSLVSRAVQQAGGKLQYIEFPGMEHNCPNPAFYGEPVWKWLFSQKKQSADNTAK